MTAKKGFTLIELLIVIGIIAVLAVVVLLTLNPAQLLAQARDSNRSSDLSTLSSALALYLADQAVPLLGTSTICNTWTGFNCSTRYSGSPTSTVNGSRAIDGTGWVPVNFTAISSGAPIGTLPVDPTNSGLLFYAYKPGPVTGAGACDNNTAGINPRCTVYKLTGVMESAKFIGLMSTDGGTSTSTYEIGTRLDL